MKKDLYYGAVERVADNIMTYGRIYPEPNGQVYLYDNFKEAWDSFRIDQRISDIRILKLRIPEDRIQKVTTYSGRTAYSYQGIIDFKTEDLLEKEIRCKYLRKSKEYKYEVILVAHAASDVWRD